MTKNFHFWVDEAEERTGLNPLAAAVQAQNKVSFKGLHHPNQILHPYFSYGHPFLSPPHGTTLMAYGCSQMLDGLVSSHPAS